MAIVIVDLPIKLGDFPYSFLYVYQRVYARTQHMHIVGRNTWIPPPSNHKRWLQASFRVNRLIIPDPWYPFIAGWFRLLENPTLKLG